MLSELAYRSRAYWGYSAEFMTACGDELTYAAEQITAPEFDFFVCEVAARVVGLYALDFNNPEIAELAALFVAPESIGRGIGRGLLEHARTHARYRGAAQIVIQAEPNAQAFYLAVGAVCGGQRESAASRAGNCRFS